MNGTGGGDLNLEGAMAPVPPEESRAKPPMLLPQTAKIFKDVDAPAAGYGMKVVTITRENVARVSRWRGERSGTHTYLQALIDGEWCQVVVTRSEPECLPPRSLRLKAGEYIWRPPAPH